MDKGAHYYRCDFQVHTPRDTQWTGGDAVTEPERKAYAEELVLACRRKGLGAIAVTDHHDFGFFPYIKQAAHDELDDSGRPLPATERLVVFPGMELTLTAPNCQALLILDATFPENLFQSVLATLAIAPAPAADSRHAAVQRVPQNVIADLTDLYSKLNNHEHIRGRFVVLPNVTESGHGTMLRSGFANYYKTMPCVGGYTDGPVPPVGTGNFSILNGQNREYGFKAIALFQTSDNRQRDHGVLGNHSTWVKWSEPTAEALRQACLAKESRLSQEDPELPSLWITSMSVSNSKFLGRLEVDFNQQYNAVIGGRGTGKSTILEYLRWGLCDEPVDATDWDIAPVQTRRRKLIDDTLQKFDGEVIITFVLNDVTHIVKRNSKTQSLLLKIGGADFVPTTDQDMRNLFPVQAYSQKQLSNVAVRIEELKRFVELPIRHELDQVRAAIRDAATRLRIAYGNVARKRQIEADVAKYNLEIASLTAQVTTLRKGLKGLSEADQATIQRKPQYDNEEAVVEGLKNEMARVEDLITGLQGQLDGEGEERDPHLDMQNRSLIESIEKKYAAKFAEIRGGAQTLARLFGAESLKAIADDLKKWDKLKSSFDREYEAAKAKAKTNQQQLKQIQEVEKRIAELKKVQMGHRNGLAALGDPQSAYAALRATWDDLHAQKVRALGARSDAFSALSAGLIQADMRGGVDVGSLKQKLKTAFAGLNIREQKIDDLCLHVSDATDPIAAWSAILVELETLSLHSVAETEPLPGTPIMKRRGFVDSERTRLCAGLTSDRWVELSVAEIEFNPIFRYCTNKTTNEYIDFGDASAGQQATALLTVLLSQAGAPLIIDQPEDDVDSKMTPELVRQIWTAKSRRQLVFASHNANFVVNGDAELVICCDYVRVGDQTGGQIKAAGAIDSSAIRDEITAVTEGGKAAFKLRKEKYGF